MTDTRPTDRSLSPASDLPDGSIVADDLKGIAFYACGDDGRWSQTGGDGAADSVADYHLRALLAAAASGAA
jgi:hypothetical protein